MKKDVKVVRFGPRSKARVLHIEVPGAIINVRVGLRCQEPNCEVTSIEIIRETGVSDYGGRWKFLDTTDTYAMNIRVGLMPLDNKSEVDP